MSRVPGVLTVVALAIVLAACALRRPEVALANVYLGSVRLDGGSLEILFDIRNPNRWGIDLQEPTYHVSIDDVPVGTGATTSRIVVPGGECATVQLPVDVSWRWVGRGARELLTIVRGRRGVLMPRTPGEGGPRGDALLP